MTRLSGSLVNFLPVDLELIDLLDDEKEAIRECAGFFEMLGRSVVWDEQWCGTLYVKGLPWLIGGYWAVAPGVFQVFMIPSVQALSQPIALARYVREWVAAIEKLGGHRLQTYSLPIPRIRRWMESLGFACEGTLRRYTKAGQDYEIWGKVK